MSGSKNKLNPPTEERRRLMQRVRRTNTAPEVVVRRVLSADGHRFSRHIKSLLGTPDIVFPKQKMAIFVHRCFWHSHDCKKGTIPKANRAFWLAKFEANGLRDQRNIASIKAIGYRPLVLCVRETANLVKLEKKLRRFLAKP